MKISTYGDEDSYSTGFICDRCGQHGEYQQERWFCLECRADICFDCISTKGVNVQSKKGLKMQWQWSSDNQHWIGCDWMVVKSGEHAGQIPGLQNRDIIEFLQRVCPIPSKGVILGTKIPEATFGLAGPIDVVPIDTGIQTIARMSAIQPTIDTMLPR